MYQATGFLFVPLLAPANQMSYDPQQFYNTSSALVAGIGVAALAFRLLPPLSPEQLTRRLQALTLRDLRRLATAPAPPTANNWKSRMYSRLSAVPEQAEPLQRAQLLAALGVGTEIIRLRRVAPRFDRRLGLNAALAAVGRDGAVAIERLARVDRGLAALPGTGPEMRIRLQARTSILVLSEALSWHAAYFDAGAPR
jgi:uncharacterized membrane protein YccC